MHLDPGMQDLSILPADRSQKAIGTTNDGVQDSSADFGREATEAIIDAVRARVDDLLKNHGRYQGHGSPM